MWTRPLRDVLLRCHVGNLRVSGVMARQTVAEAARRWQLPVASEGSRLWAEYMAGTAMFGAFFKGEERVKLTVRSPAIRELSVEAMAVGEVRGRADYLDTSVLAKPHRGSMQVSKILYGATKPYETTIESFGVPELDWQSFFDVSEQVPTIVRIDSDVSEDEHARCCGFIVQKMPDAIPTERHYELEELRFEDHPFRANELVVNGDLVEYLNKLIPGASINEKNCKKLPLDFFCRCSRDGFASRLQQLGKEELTRVASDVGDAGVDLTCHFCNENYHFAAVELDTLISDIAK